MPHEKLCWTFGHSFLKTLITSSPSHPLEYIQTLLFRDQFSNSLNSHLVTTLEKSFSTAQIYKYLHSPWSCSYFLSCVPIFWQYSATCLLEMFKVYANKPKWILAWSFCPYVSSVVTSPKSMSEGDSLTQRLLPLWMISQDTSKVHFQRKLSACFCSFCVFKECTADILQRPWKRILEGLALWWSELSYS